MSDYLAHYGRSKADGAPVGSGRWPWGSGDNPYQHTRTFLSGYKEYKAKGLSDQEIADEMHLTVGKLRNLRTVANNEEKKEMASLVVKYHKKGYSNLAIAKKLGIADGTVRNYLKDDYRARLEENGELLKLLKDEVAKKKYLDIGEGVERQLGISDVKLKQLAEQLEAEGYIRQNIYVDQPTNPGKKTTVVVLSKDTVTKSELYENVDKIQSIHDVYSDDGGRTIRHILPPTSIDSKRIDICYGDAGGSEKDGVIEIRPGVADISLGQNRYAQVRILVDGKYYLKGMAMYSDKVPPGKDIVFNTNKATGTPKEKVLKPIEDDPNNPFGTSISRQYNYIDKDGTEKLSAINIVNEDADWKKWSKTVSSQVLSKQLPSLAKQQLKIAYDSKKMEYEDIMDLTNPTLKKSLLLQFADSCDSAAVHLKAAAFPRQRQAVILPVTSLKDTEVYAPTLEQGEEVVLIRYPHGGKFEMPRLVVNNRNKEAKKSIGNAEYAVGINSKVAERLSGADFDGDTVTVIPTRGVNIQNAPALKELKNFDPKVEYRAYEGMPAVDKKKNKKSTFNKQMEMGKVSNLITDMTIKGAPMDDIAKAVKHSMVVIDAEKHNLDWKRSEKENDIINLKKKYQGENSRGQAKGASTLISRASSQTYVNERDDRYSIDPKDGSKIFRYSGRKYTWGKKEGQPIQQESTQMYEVSNAHDLSSGSKIEKVYGDHANELKALANKARKSYLGIKETQYNPSAYKEYSKEVSDVKTRLNVALKHAPVERRAIMVANKEIKAWKMSNPEASYEEKQKVSAQILSETRARAGGGKERIDSFSDREWEAIQAGAFRNTTLQQIFRNSDQDMLKERAMPREDGNISNFKISRAKSLLNNGYTWDEVAKAVGISQSTLSKIINK